MEAIITMEDMEEAMEEAMEGATAVAMGVMEEVKKRIQKQLFLFSGVLTNSLLFLNRIWIRPIEHKSSFLSHHNISHLLYCVFMLF